MKKYFLLALLSLLISCSKEKVVEHPVSKNPYYEKAWYYLDRNDADSAFVNFSKVTSNSSDSLLIAKSFTHMAVIQGDQGDYFGSEESAVKAIRYFDPGSNYLPGVFNSIAIAKYNLKDYKNSSYWYKRAINSATDSLNKLQYQNNLAVSLAEQKHYKEAISVLNNLLKKNLIINNKEKFSQAFDNLVWVKWLEDPAYNAAPDFLRALSVRKKENNIWGQNASYAHLADFYMQRQPDSALYYSKNMYHTATEVASPDDQIEALKKLIKLANEQESKKYFGIYSKISDSLQTARNAAKNQFALIRYESEKNKADNLKLQKDNTQKKYQIIKRDIIIYGVIILIISALIIGNILYRKRKQKIERDAFNKIQENRLKTSKKVHDVVANGLYRVMTEIENQSGIEKEEILDRLDDMYQKSRDISYEVEEFKLPEHEFNQKIEKLLYSFNTNKTTIDVKGNTKAFWDNLDRFVKQELEHVLQELMVNMKKHSYATMVSLVFEENLNQLYITYTDNGVGIKGELNRNNGLTNTGNRIENINGRITFETKVEKGLKILISLPLL
ncbi:MAG: ATP-binding protein [Sphingobacteriales bacterium]|nr:MAG: ATP-binding protein [Sphingobacteriales bacterium]